MDLLGQPVFFLGADGEDFVLARDETVFTIEQLRAGVISLRGEEAHQPATEVLGGKRLLDHRISTLARSVGLVGPREVPAHEQYSDFRAHTTQAACQLETAHAIHVGTGDQRIDLDLRRPKEILAAGVIVGAQHSVLLVAEGAEKRSAVVLVVDQQHAEGALRVRVRR
jgi:hypothetical protein